MTPLSARLPGRYRPQFLLTKGMMGFLKRKRDWGRGGKQSRQGVQTLGITQESLDTHGAVWWLDLLM